MQDADACLWLTDSLSSEIPLFIEHFTVPKRTPAHLRQIEPPYHGHERKRVKKNNSEDEIIKRWENEIDKTLGVFAYEIGTEARIWEDDAD